MWKKKLKHSPLFSSAFTNCIRYVPFGMKSILQEFNWFNFHKRTCSIVEGRIMQYTKLEKSFSSYFCSNCNYYVSGHHKSSWVICKQRKFKCKYLSSWQNQSFLGSSYPTLAWNFVQFLEPRDVMFICIFLCGKENKEMKCIFLLIRQWVIVKNPSFWFSYIYWQNTHK